MSSTTSSPALVTTGGAAVGRLSGVNHLQLIVRDMDESVRFYRDVLGLRVVRTKADYPAPGRGYRIVKNTFFDMGNNSYLSLIQIDGDPVDDDEVEPSVSSDWLWPHSTAKHRNPTKMDHVAFNVATHDDMVWFRQHLLDHGVKATEIISREDENWVESLYFYDPDGIPLEIATFDWDHPRWGSHDPDEWFWDEDPVPSLLGK